MPHLCRAIIDGYTNESKDKILEPRARMNLISHLGQTSLWKWVLTLGILFLEMAFKASTTGGFWPALPVICLFSLSIGQLLHLLCSLAPTQGARRTLKLVVLAVLGALFSVEYFVYLQFKVFYDPTTIITGAGGVASQFGSEASALVFTPNGIGHLVLFFLPALVYVELGMRRQLDKAPALDIYEGVTQSCIVLASYLVALPLIAALGSMAELYTTRYSFENAVQNFGVLTSLRKAAQAQMTGGNSYELVAEDTKAEAPQQEVPQQDEDQSQATPDEPTYTPATLDIDFEKLAASTDNETWAELDNYVAGITPSSTNEYTGLFEGYNLIFISAEAFTKEAIRPDITPTLYQMWEEGIQLTDYYQFDTAGTTGGECANLFGLLATEGGSSVKMTATYNNYLTMGNLLGKLGYEGWAFHNNTYTYYGRDATHNNLGYNHGYMGYGNGMEQWVAWQWPESDLEMVQGTFDNLYGSSSPFNVYYMSVSGHSNYDPWDNAMAQKNWDVVKDLPYSDRVKGYLGANVELDRAMEWLLGRLKEQRIYRKTVIVISADHFPYGLDDDGALKGLPYLSELFGYEASDIFKRDHNAPIIWCGSLPKNDLHIEVSSPTTAIDLLPTLCNLFGVAWDSRLLPGRDVLDPNTEGIAFNLNYDWRTDLGTYWAGSGSFEPVEGAEIPKGYVEDHSALVANKIAYCHKVLTSDYYRHVFGDPQT